MLRLLTSAVLVLAMVVAVQAQGDKDTPKAAATRKALEIKISVDFKDTSLNEITEEIRDLVKEKKGPILTWRRAAGVSGNRKFSVTAKDKSVKEILDLLLDKEGLTYTIISGANNAYDGAIEIRVK
jgi:hypothetical protein